MVEIFIGIISGVVTSLGMGGGTVLIMLLTMICNLDQHIAQASNIVFFVPTAVCASLINLKNKKVNLNLAITTISSGIIGTIIGAVFSATTNTKNLKKYFGIFLGIIAIYEIYNFTKEYILNKKGKNKNE